MISTPGGHASKFGPSNLLFLPPSMYLSPCWWLCKGAERDPKLLTRRYAPGNAASSPLAVNPTSAVCCPITSGAGASEQEGLQHYDSAPTKAFSHPHAPTPISTAYCPVTNSSPVVEPASHAVRQHFHPHAFSKSVFGEGTGLVQRDKPHCSMRLLPASLHGDRLLLTATVWTLKAP